MITWKKLDLHGAVDIAKLCGEYLVTDVKRVPTARFRIKVYERTNDFMALPNLHLRDAAGDFDGICGLGATELEALQDLLARMGEALDAQPSWEEDDFVWADPRDF